ncbi:MULTISPECIES: hypothetical protein [Pantoea]|nr:MULTISPECIES: hypothetical protein [Pantoea]
MITTGQPDKGMLNAAAPVSGYMLAGAGNMHHSSRVSAPRAQFF